jgi:hypothetical protein
MSEENDLYKKHMYMIYSYVDSTFDRGTSPICVVNATEDEIEKGIARLRYWKFSRHDLRFTRIKHFDSIDDISKFINEQKTKELEENAEYQAVKNFIGAY